MTVRTDLRSPSRYRRFLLEALPQGEWGENSYLTLTDYMRRVVEYTDGFLEILAWPTLRHQAISGQLLMAFDGFLDPLGGEVLFGIRIKIRKEKYRQPDLLMLRSATDERRQDRFWTGADLVVEVVSREHPDRDLIVKRRDYAEARIPEYWIVNPLNETITVLGLNKKRYRRLGKYGRGDMARSNLLDGFEVSVEEVFDKR